MQINQQRDSERTDRIDITRTRRVLQQMTGLTKAQRTQALRALRQDWTRR